MFLRLLGDGMSILVYGESLFQSLSYHTFKFNINLEKSNKQKLSLASDHGRIVRDLLASVLNYSAVDDFTCVFD